jgi:hypothetical protein
MPDADRHTRRAPTRRLPDARLLGTDRQTAERLVPIADR